MFYVLLNGDKYSLHVNSSAYVKIFSTNMVHIWSGIRTPAAGARVFVLMAGLDTGQNRSEICQSQESE